MIVIFGQTIHIHRFGLWVTLSQISCLPILLIKTLVQFFLKFSRSLCENVRLPAKPAFSSMLDDPLPPPDHNISPSCLCQIGQGGNLFAQTQALYVIMYFCCFASDSAVQPTLHCHSNHSGSLL